MNNIDNLMNLSSCQSGKAENKLISVTRKRLEQKN